MTLITCLSLRSLLYCKMSLARCQLSVTYSFQMGVRERQAVRRFLHPPPFICLLLFFSCACVLQRPAHAPRPICAWWKRGSDLLDSTSFSRSPWLDCGLLERIDRNIWNTIVPSHSHIWSTMALAPELQKHSSELKSVHVVPRLSQFSQHGINVLMWGGVGGTYLSFSEVEVDGNLVAP